LKIDDKLRFGIFLTGKVQLFSYALLLAIVFARRSQADTFNLISFRKASLV
jgi:hypothetical protein